VKYFAAPAVKRIAVQLQIARIAIRGPGWTCPNSTSRIKRGVQEKDLKRGVVRGT